MSSGIRPAARPAAAHALLVGRDVCLLVLSASNVRSILSLEDCIALQETAFKLAERKDKVTTHSDRIPLPAENGWIKLLTGIDVESGYGGLKMTCRLQAKGDNSLSGLMILLALHDNRVIAVMEASYLTMVRTGAAAAVAARWLAIPGAHRVGVIGAGPVARSTIQGLATELKRPLEVRVYSRSSDRVSGLLKEMAEFPQIRALPTSDPLQATGSSEIVVTATSSRSPVLFPRHLREGACILMMGRRGEVDGSCFTLGSIIVDDIEMATREGKIADSVLAGVIHREEIRGELGQVITGSKMGRVSDREIVFFDSTGMAMQDALCAAYCYQQALKRGIGTEVALDS